MGKKYNKNPPNPKMELPNRKFGNIKNGSGARFKAKNTIMGAAQVNIGVSKDMSDLKVI